MRQKTQTRYRFHAFLRASCKALSVFALICISVFALPAFGVSEPSAYTRAADNLPFGLDRIRWGMSSAEVQLAYPELQFASDFYDLTGAAWGPRVLFISQYRYDDCTFDMAFTFFHARLASVQAHSVMAGDALQECRMKIAQDFASQYGRADRDFPHWSGPVTNIEYDVPGYSICPSVAVVCPPPPPGPRRPAPPPLRIAFSDAKDISGAVEDQRAKESQCLSITAEFIGDNPGDGSSAPFIVPGIRNLGCDDYYPPVSYRLQEQGRVIVEAHILADGSVTETKLASPNRSPRLNDAALNLVRRRLVINPAFKDGRPTEATGQIAITFTITHFIHGVP